MSFLRSQLQTIGVIAALLAIILAKHAWDVRQLQGHYDRWKSEGQRAAAPPAISGAKNQPTEEGIHDR